MTFCSLLDENSSIWSLTQNEPSCGITKVDGNVESQVEGRWMCGEFLCLHIAPEAQSSCYEKQKE